MELLSLCALISRMIPLVTVFHQPVNAKHCFCHNIAYIIDCSVKNNFSLLFNALYDKCELVAYQLILIIL